jgi:hypothetical protein
VTATLRLTASVGLATFCRRVDLRSADMLGAATRR